jgi:hypothetical protein
MVASHRKHLLLMTATITPGNALDLARVDPSARLMDYVQALTFYLTLINHPLDGIVFVENSDSDVSILRQVVEQQGQAHRVEFLCNYGHVTYAEKGRAYGEFKLLDFAMSNSSMVQQAGEAGVIWKITGRYIVRNLQSVIHRSPKSFDVYVDMKNQPMPWMDMRLMAWTRRGYDKVLFGLADALDSNMNERVMRHHFPEMVPGLSLVRRFRCEPFVEGVRGYDNANYSKGRNLLKFYIRTAGRAIVPWLWI